MQILNQDFKNRIEQKIASLEKNTSVEFVTVIASRSASYLSFRLNVVLLGFILCFAGLTFKNGFQDPLMPIFFSFLFSIFVFFILKIQCVLRRALPAILKHIEVEELAHSVFLKEEIFATERRTGVLIFISALERSVFVMADKGVLNVVKAEEWAGLGQELAKNFQKESAGETFLSALDQVSLKLGGQFPPSTANANEIKNHVRVLSF